MKEKKKEKKKKKKKDINLHEDDIISARSRRLIGAHARSRARARPRFLDFGPTTSLVKGILNG